jgi:alanyl-tRNA synthetase
VKGVSVLVRRMDGLTPSEARTAVDTFKNLLKSGIVVLGAIHEEKAFLVVGVTSDLTGRIAAGNVVKKLAPLIGGGGGGRPDFAQAGGSDTAALDRALEESGSILESML